MAVMQIGVVRMPMHQRQVPIQMRVRLARRAVRTVAMLVMFVVGLLAFEMAGTMWNYHQPGRTTGFGIVLHPVAKYFDPTLPD